MRKMSWLVCAVDVYMRVMRWIRISDCESKRSCRFVSCRAPHSASWSVGGSGSGVRGQVYTDVADRFYEARSQLSQRLQHSN